MDVRLPGTPWLAPRGYFSSSEHFCNAAVSLGLALFRHCAYFWNCSELGDLPAPPELPGSPPGVPPGRPPVPPDDEPPLVPPMPPVAPSAPPSPRSCLPSSEIGLALAGAWI